MDGVQDIVLGDKVLDIDELVYLLKTLVHLQEVYLGDFWQNLKPQIDSLADDFMNTEETDQMIHVFLTRITEIMEKVIEVFCTHEKYALQQHLPKYEHQPPKGRKRTYLLEKMAKLNISAEKSNGTSDSSDTKSLVSQISLVSQSQKMNMNMSNCGKK